MTIQERIERSLAPDLVDHKEGLRMTRGGAVRLNLAAGRAEVDFIEYTPGNMGTEAIVSYSNRKGGAISLRLLRPKDIVQFATAVTESKDLAESIKEEILTTASNQLDMRRRHVDAACAEIEKLKRTRQDS